MANTFAHPSKPTVFSMIITPMDEDGALDEDGLRSHLRRMVDAGVGVYLGSGGSGEGHALEPEELHRVYEIGVEECKGKVPVYCNPPEARSANEMIKKARLAIDAGVEMVQYYQLDAGHGRTPVLIEQERYFRDLLDNIDYPVALSIHQAVGYLAPVTLTQKLCNDYPHVKAVNLAFGPTLNYFIQLQDGIRSDVKLYVGMNNFLGALPLGTWGCQATEPNIAPNLCRSIVDHYLAGDIEKAGEAYANALRVWTAMTLAARVSADTGKATLKALGLPGGVPRPPRVFADDGTIAQIRKELEAMNLYELEGLRKP